jgi:pimeloyl-ACP methyl ester carboxylesterase
VIAFEMPGFGESAENTRSGVIQDLANTMAATVRALGVETFDLMGTSFGGKVSLWQAALNPDRVRALVLEAPAAIRPESSRPASGTPEEMARRLYAHPERMPPLPAVKPAVRAKMLALVERLRGSDRDAALEERMRGIETPVLVLFGTLDRIVSSEMWRHYKALLPHCHLISV